MSLLLIPPSWNCSGQDGRSSLVPVLMGPGRKWFPEKAMWVISSKNLRIFEGFPKRDKDNATMEEVTI